MSLPSLKIKAQVPFPTLVQATGGIKVAKSGGIWTISPDFPALAELGSISNPSAKQVWIFDPSTGIYNVVSAATLGAALIADQMNFRNIAIANGGFEIWQRGTSIAVAASTTAYTADRWYIKTGANQASTVSRQTGNVVRSQYAARVQRDSGQTGTGAMYFAMPLDTDELVRLREKQAVLSFNVSAGANWSPTSGELTYKVYCGTGSVAKRGSSAYTGETNPISGTVNLSQGQSATVYSSAISSAIGSGITQAEIQFTWTPTGTAGANDWFQIDDVQIETVPTGTVTFSPIVERADTHFYLQRCRKMFRRQQGYSSYSPFGMGQAKSATQGVYIIPLDPEMRVTPTLSFSAADTFRITDGADNSIVCTVIAANVLGRQAVRVVADVAAGLTIGQGSTLFRDGTDSAYIDLSSEI